MSTSLAASHQHCRAVARRRARNFYYSFLLLDRARRDAICAIYAFMRRCDDLSDENAGSPDAARQALGQWRQDMERTLDGRIAPDPCWPAFRDAVLRYGIPRQYFHDMIDGVSADLEEVRIRDFQELYGYCYRVASVVGMSVIHIFGFRSPDALLLAEKCGIAFQLTNILRDVREDAARGRVYLPAEDLARFQVPLEQLSASRESEAFCRLMRFQTERARRYYVESEPLLDMVDAASRPSLWALITIYRTLLERIEECGYCVLQRRVRLAALEKTWILVRALLGDGRLLSRRRTSG